LYTPKKLLIRSPLIINEKVIIDARKKRYRKIDEFIEKLKKQKQK